MHVIGIAFKNAVFLIHSLSMIFRIRRGPIKSFVRGHLIFKLDLYFLVFPIKLFQDIKSKH